MTRTAEKINTLVREDGSMTDALDAIRRAADANGGTVEWADVRDDLSSGQWGRIIEKGLLIDSEDGFKIADREAYDSALDGDGETSVVDDIEIDEEASSWSQWDKLAGVGALMMMVGYYFDPVRDTVAGTINMVMAPLEATLPFYAVVLSVALLTGLYSTLLQANLMDTERMGKYQERLKAMQKKRKDVEERKKAAKERDASEAELSALDDEMEAVQEEQMEAMADNLGMFKEQFRPMVWIMLLTIPLFLWMWWKIHDVGLTGGSTIVMPLVGDVGWNEDILGPLRAWILWYFVCSMGFTQLLRKAINIDMTPSGT